MAPRGVLLSELFLNSLIGEIVKGIKRWLKIGFFVGKKNSFLGCFKVASWPVLLRVFFLEKQTQPTGSAKITGVHRETMKRGWGRVDV